MWPLELLPLLQFLAVAAGYLLENTFPIATGAAHLSHISKKYCIRIRTRLGMYDQV